MTGKFRTRFCIALAFGISVALPADPASAATELLYVANNHGGTVSVIANRPCGDPAPFGERTG